jgi:hypothetical protein
MDIGSIKVERDVYMYFKATNLGWCGEMRTSNLLFQGIEIKKDKSNGLPDTHTTTITTSPESYTPTRNESITKDFIASQNLPFPPVITSLLFKCHEAGYEVKCDRTHCGYYQISLGDEDLGTWSELGVLGVLGGLHEEFYRQRLIPSMAAHKETVPVTVEEAVPAIRVKTVAQEPELITRLDKLKGQQLTEIQNWCNSIKHLISLAI